MNITVSAYNRPAYLERTLAALRRCDRVGDCRVMVMCDPCDETEEQLAIAARHGFPAGVYGERLGCNKAIGAALAYGFEQLKGDYHLHLEDDAVPCRDALRWFLWAGEHYRSDKRVMNVSGYQRISNGHLAECGIRRWFTPWGWATWRDRWDELAAGWARSDAYSWDVIVNHVLRGERFEAFPTVSRIQNIGGEKGTHVPSPEWHAANHHVPITADDLSYPASFPVLEWKHVREDERADHA